ncbi:MAG: hypothetical protein M3T56_10275 [Chloroflexota bacterium]|nr:hypothetical protein [Chloroflexota bacterium]
MGIATIDSPPRRTLAQRRQGLVLRVARIERGFTVEQVATRSRITARRQRQIEVSRSVSAETEERFWQALADLESEAQ